jgi:uncharacterized membrane-anchored protein
MKRISIKAISMKNAVLLVLLLQVAALGSVAGKREWIRAQGEQVYLRTAPVDPRDLFRGDYVQLEYEITQPEESLVPEDLLEQPHQEIYLRLERDELGIAHLVGIETEEPDGLFIKGQWGRKWRAMSRNRSIAKLGIEKYFVQQDSGLPMEKRRGRAQQWQTPMEMEVALGSDGTAVIRDHRWSDMGVRLEVLERGEPARNRRRNNDRQPGVDENVPDEPVRISPKLKISLRNQSDRTLGVLDTPEHCAFTLTANRSANAYAVIGTPRRHCETADWTLHTLRPKDVYSIEIDLAEPDWFVWVDGKEQEIGALQNRGVGYRWIYQSPKEIVMRHGDDSELWSSSLRTARFIAGGRID